MIVGYSALCQSLNNKTFPLLKLKNATIGFYTGADITLNRAYQKVGFNTTSSTVLLNKALTRQLKLETGLTFNTYTIQKQTSNPNNPLRKTLKIPVTIQYYFLPGQYKFQPYLGIGTLLSTRKLNTNSEVSTDAANASQPTPNKYISILFTQGATYEVNTKIQLLESIHVLNLQNTPTISVNVGIGFKLP